MKLLSLSLFIFFIVQPAFGADKKDAAAAASAAPAEAPKTPLTFCTSEISYKWKRIAPAVPAVDPGAAAKKTKGSPPSPATTPDPEIYGPMESSALSITENGEIESEVKARVEAQLPAALARAMEICVELHQNQGSCLTKK